MHPAHEKASFGNVEGTLGNFWLYIEARFVYFQGI